MTEVSSPGHYRFADFASAFAFAERVADDAAAGSAPALTIVVAWGLVTIAWSAAPLDDATVARWAELARTLAPGRPLPFVLGDAPPAGSLAAEPFVLPRAGDPALSPAAAAAACGRLGAGWTLDAGKLRRTYQPTSRAAVWSLARQLAALAEQLGHHPELTMADRRLEVLLWTHDVGGLTPADVILAARCERVWLARDDAD